MKTKIINLFLCILLLSMLVTECLIAQQSQYSQYEKLSPQRTVNLPRNSNYTYRLFTAPNQVMGYDIFENGGLVFHQPALAQPAGDKTMALIKRPDADKAAMLAINKIRKGTPLLTHQELSGIVTH